MFRWTDESIELWERAEKYTDHYRKLEKKLEEVIDKEDIVYDIGCGLGFVDIELAQHVKAIKGFDIEQRVLNELEKNAKDSGIYNISVSSEDWTKLKDNSCDTLMACSFGNIVECLDDFLRIAKKQIVLVKRLKVKPSKKYVAGIKAFSAEASEEYLKERGIEYTKTVFESEFGQPLKSYDEALWFTEFHGMNRGVPVEEFLKENLMSGEKYGYEYYLPNKKDMVIFVINKGDNVVHF